MTAQNSLEVNSSAEKEHHGQEKEDHNTRERSRDRSPERPSSGQISPSPNIRESQQKESNQPVDTKTKAHVSDTAAMSDKRDQNWEEKTIPTEPKPSHKPDEAASHRAGDQNTDKSTAHKEDTSYIDPKVVNVDDNNEFVKPISETERWVNLQPDPAFDPAFVRDGDLPNDAPLSKAGQRDTGSVSGKVDIEETYGKKRKHRASDSSTEELRQKHPRPEMNVGPGRKSFTEDAPTDQRRNSRRTFDDNSRSHREIRERSRTPDRRPKPAGRGVTVDSRSPPGGARMELHESYASDSSDLSSLAAELLGRAKKKRSRNNKERRGREEANRAQRVRRRRPEADSAYR